MKKEKVKTYKKSALRKTLEKQMQEYWHDPAITVAPMDFSRMLKTYCEKFGLDEKLCKSKTLEESVVDALGTWLGYPLR